ncbi:hypothetical protein BDD12DRAFT_896100 [Trichophaea hybrida]|nr:hypothetical protein BDD12DRAFT_896100 [Trichophaea hybrida]
MGHAINNLRNEIEKLRKKNTDGKYFVCPGDLKELLTRETITRVIRECSVPDYQQSDIANLIFTEGSTLFAILIWKKWQHKLMSFVERGVLDKQLPLSVNEAEDIAEMFGGEFADTVQWEFRPRKLTKDMGGYHCYFKDEEVLPFIAEDELGEGTYGKVWRMSVLPSLQSIFPKSNSSIFMVKKKLKLHAKRGELYMEREKECLRILDHLRHPNIVPLLASYSYRGDHYFLFPLYRMDLQQFLQLEHRFGEFDKDLTFYIALEGLTSAIGTVHSLNMSTKDHDMALNRIGYHHDIRPANILVDTRTFYLSDFGLARMKPGGQDSRTEWKPILGDYIAPECMDENLRGREVSRPLDIWSVGCALSEIAAYINNGRAGVEAFQMQRCGPSALRPNIIDHNFFRGASLKTSVIDWFERSISGSNSAVFRNLLNIAKSTLIIDPKKRPKALDIQPKLSFLSVQALYDAAQQAFTCYLHSDVEQESGPCVATAQLENKRLIAWGRVLHLTGDDASDETIAAVSKNGEVFRSVLSSLMEQLDTHTKADEAKSSSPIVFPIRKPFYEELQKLIDDLCNPLSNRYQQKLRQVWLEDVLITPSQALEALSGIGPSSQTDRYSELSALTSSKLENLRLKRVDEQVSESHQSTCGSICLALNELHVEKQLAEGLQIARYHEEQVIVEWASDTAQWKDLSRSEKRQRMQLTADFFHRCSKSSGIRVLDCIGFLEPISATSDDYGMVYAFPTNAPESSTQRKAITPINLSHILKTRDKVDLSLGVKFQLAYKLVSCVQELHMIGWLHKNINSRNVLFFQEEGDDVSSLSDVLEHPYLINFRYSREVAKVSQSNKPTKRSMAEQHSQHPDYIGEQHFREEYDYYSVGVLLLELAGWTPIESFLDHNPMLTSNPSAFRDVLVNKYVPRLKHLMGDTYTNVTLACLSCDFGRSAGSRDMDNQTVLGKFQDKVVGPLCVLSKSPI